MPAPGDQGPEVVTQESLLLGAAERISRIRDGRIAVHVHLSRLKPQNRQDGHVRIALRMLEPVINAYRGQMFLLETSDIVVMLKDANLADVENMIFKLRALFSKDPLTFNDSGDGIDNFCTWYDLGDGPDYQAFLIMARGAAQDARRRSRDKTGQRSVLKPLDSKLLADLLERMQGIDAGPLVRRQAAIVIRADGKAEVLFQEVYVAMAELQKALAPDVNLMGNRWLFQHLSQTLDLRVLGALSTLALRANPPAFSLNLNIATVGTKAFEEFTRTIEGRARLAVEIQVLDVLAGGRGYVEARDHLRQAGHRVIIDGLGKLTMQFMDVAQFDADLYKIVWSPDLAETVAPDDAASRTFAALGADKLLLSRCDSEAAISWGLGHGIQRFQGRYVDAMLAAYTMQICDKAAACSLAQCTARHAVLGGPLRAECGNNDMLDSSPLMRAPRARATPPKEA